MVRYAVQVGSYHPMVVLHWCAMYASVEGREKLKQAMKYLQSL